MAYLQYKALEDGNGLSNSRIDTEDNIIQQYGVDSSRMAYKVFKLKACIILMIASNINIDIL
jgi:aryl carrier-like protein